VDKVKPLIETESPPNGVTDWDTCIFPGAALKKAGIKPLYMFGGRSLTENPAKPL
jgi:hypothetical protein